MQKEWHFYFISQNILITTSDNDLKPLPDDFWTLSIKIWDILKIVS